MLLLNETPRSLKCPLVGRPIPKLVKKDFDVVGEDASGHGSNLFVGEFCCRLQYSRNQVESKFGGQEGALIQG